MRIVVALGGNALLKRGEPMTHDVQRANIRVAAQAHLVEHARLRRLQVEAEVDGVDPERGRRVVFAAHRLGLAFAHGIHLWKS